LLVLVIWLHECVDALKLQCQYPKSRPA